MWLGLLFIAGGEVLANYPPAPYKCRISPYTVCVPLFQVPHYTALCLVSFIRGSVLGRIHASYPYITSRLSGPRYCWLGQTCLDNILHLIHLDTNTLHDVIAWYYFTVFC
jgi:hypothetical protein